MQISVKADVKKATRYLSLVERQAVPVATAKALTFTAERAQKAVTRLIPQVFSSPTPLTRGAIRIESATVRKRASSVLMKDRPIERERYLLVQTDLRTSAVRPKKRSEKRLLGSYWVVGRRAKTNRFGNLTKATYLRILADVGGRGRRAGAQDKEKGKRKQYFMIGESPRRIILRRFSKRRAVPWLVEVGDVPTYGRRLPMNRVTQQTVRQQFPRLFDKAMARETTRIRTVV